MNEAQDSALLSERLETPEEVADRETRRHIRIEKRELEAMDEAAGMLEHAAARITHLERQLEVEQAKTSTLALVEQLFLAGRGGQLCCDSRTPFNTAAPSHAKKLRDLAEAKAKAIDEANRQMGVRHAIERINQAGKRVDVSDRKTVFDKAMDRLCSALREDPNANAIVIDTYHLLTREYLDSHPELKHINLVSPAKAEEATPILTAATRAAQGGATKLYAVADGVYYTPENLAFCAQS